LIAATLIPRKCYAKAYILSFGNFGWTESFLILEFIFIDKQPSKALTAIDVSGSGMDLFGRSILNKLLINCQEKGRSYG